MTNTNATNFRKDLFEYLSQAIDYNSVINVSTKNGNAVVISEKEYNSMIETLYLLGVPTMEDKLLKGKEEKAEDCVEW